MNSKPAGNIKKLANAIDRNGNGKIDLGDFGIEESDVAEVKEKTAELASKAGETAKKGAEFAVKVFDDAKIELDRKNLRPVFKDDLFAGTTSKDLADTGKSIQSYSMIVIVDKDKKHSESLACKGAIGHIATIKGMDVLNLYKDKARGLGLQFYPNISKTIYYEDPFQSNFYISLDDYFDYFKKARVSELAMIAKELGAKHVKITLNEKKKTFITAKGKANAKAGKKAGADISLEKEDSQFASMDVADEETFSGSSTPVQPELTYFRNENDILKLVKMCMSRSDKDPYPITSKKYCFKCSKSSGISESAAIKIDAVIDAMGCSGTASFSSEAQRENRTEFEYFIEFPG